MTGPKEKPSAESKLCFVIAPIGEVGSTVRKQSDLVLHLLLKEVLEKDPHNYLLRRGDEDPTPGMIGDRIVLDVTRSELCIADLSDLNPNVFYELGIRHATEKPVIHIARVGTDLPFDSAAHSTIFYDLTDYESIVRARMEISKSAAAITKAGFKVSNPITQANASFRMKYSADPQDRVISDMKAEIDALSKKMDARDRELAYQRPNFGEGRYVDSDVLWPSATRFIGQPNVRAGLLSLGSGPPRTRADVGQTLRAVAEVAVLSDPEATVEELKREVEATIGISGTKDWKVEVEDKGEAVEFKFLSKLANPILPIVHTVSRSTR